MKPIWLFAPIVALIFTSHPAPGADLSKIERTIAKEPAYQNKPKYCLLVFGPEAKTRIWLVLDGNVLYIDRNGNGDLTAADKRVEGKQSANGKFVFFRDKKFVPIPAGAEFSLVMKVFENGRVELDFRTYDKKDVFRKQDTQEEDLRFADRPQDAPILSFDGALSFKLADPKKAFVRGGATLLSVRVGTPGLGEEAFLRYYFETATATIVFPNRNPQDKPIVIQVALKADG